MNFLRIFPRPYPRTLQDFFQDQIQELFMIFSTFMGFNMDFVRMPEFNIFGDVLEDRIQDYTSEFLENISNTTFKTTKELFKIFLSPHSRLLNLDFFLEFFKTLFKNIESFFLRCF